MLDDWTRAEVPARTGAALRLLEAMTLRPHEVDAAFVRGAIADGVDADAACHVAAVAFHFNLMNRLADAFDFALATPSQQARMSWLLNLAGRRRGRAPTLADCQRGADGLHRPHQVEALHRDLLDKPGVVAPSERQAVAAFVRAAWEDEAPRAESLSEPRRAYLTKLARHAYRIVDEDLDALRADGSTDEAIYEITAVGAAVSASIGLEQVCAALRDASEATAGD